MELVNNDSRLLLVATSYRYITSISNTLVISTDEIKMSFNPLLDHAKRFIKSKGDYF